MQAKMSISNQILNSKTKDWSPKTAKHTGWTNISFWGAFGSRLSDVKQELPINPCMIQQSVLSNKYV